MYYNVCPITYYTKLKSMPNANALRNQIEQFQIIDNFVNEHRKKIWQITLGVIVG